MSPLRKIYNKIFYTFHHIIEDKSYKTFKNLIKNRYQNKYVRKNSKEIILIDFFDYYPFIIYWAEICNYLNNKYGFQLKYFYFPFHNSLFSKYNFFLKKRKKIYESFNCFELINEIDSKIDNNLKEKIIKSYKNKVASKEELLNYKIKDILVGDLIYDTFLRTKSSRAQATIDNLNDPYLINLVVRSHIIVDKLLKVFDVYNVKLLLPSHSSYIQYGISVRIATKNKVPVIFLYKKGLSGKKIYFLNKDDNQVYDNLPYYRFKETFNKMDASNKKEALRIGEELIKKRFSGEGDNYMKKFKVNPYKKNIKDNSIKLNDKKKFFIFTHCFFDTSHNFRNMIFVDLYEWIIQTIKIIKLTQNHEIYIKSHPFSKWGNKQILEKIIKIFPEVILISEEVSNHDIIDSKPELILTVHGSVGHEFPVKKIAVLNAGDNQHINYNFNLHANNYEEYKDMILNIEKHKKDINFSYDELSEFWYMRFFHYFKDDVSQKAINDNSKLFEFNNQQTNSSINLKSINVKFDTIFDEINWSFQSFCNNEFKNKF